MILAPVMVLDQITSPAQPVTVSVVFSPRVIVDLLAVTVIAGSGVTVMV